MKIIEVYKPRFFDKSLQTELIELWHISKVPCSLDRYKRLLWTCKKFVKKYPEYSMTGIYKDLTCILEGY